MNAFAKKIVGRRARLLPTEVCDLIRVTPAEMIQRGLTKSETSRMVAALALANAVACPVQEYQERITSPGTAMAYCLRGFSVLAAHRKQEEFWMVTLDTKNQPIRKHQITVGTLRNSLVHPREVFRPAIVDSANCIIVVHNHPSGDPTPSDADLDVTTRLEAAAEIIGIPIIDHIVVGIGKAVSIQEWRSGNRW
jgi:DNA repair protein RadC